MGTAESNEVDIKDNAISISTLIEQCKIGQWQCIICKCDNPGFKSNCRYCGVPQRHSEQSISTKTCDYGIPNRLNISFETTGQMQFCCKTKTSKSLDKYLDSLHEYLGLDHWLNQKPVRGKFPHTVDIVLLGINSSTKDWFYDQLRTQRKVYGSDFRNKLFRLEDDNFVKAKIRICNVHWSNDSINIRYISGAHGVIFTYDNDDMDSLQRLENIMEMFGKSMKIYTVCLLLGFIKDRGYGSVVIKKGDKLAKKWNMSHMRIDCRHMVCPNEQEPYRYVIDRVLDPNFVYIAEEKADENAINSPKAVISKALVVLISIEQYFGDDKNVYKLPDIKGAKMDTKRMMELFGFEYN